jgi:hypothetical protein
MNTEGKTDELLLLTCAPEIHTLAMEQLAEVLKMTVTTISGEICFITDVRIDEENHQIYGRGHRIEEYGTYR